MLGYLTVLHVIGYLVAASLSASFGSAGAMLICVCMIIAMHWLRVHVGHTMIEGMNEMLSPTTAHVQPAGHHCDAQASHWPLLIAWFGPLLEGWTVGELWDPSAQKGQF